MLDELLLPLRRGCFFHTVFAAWWDQGASNARYRTPTSARGTSCVSRQWWACATTRARVTAHPGVNREGVPHGRNRGGLFADVNTAVAEEPQSGHPGQAPTPQGAVLCPACIDWDQTAGCGGLCEGTAFLLMIFSWKTSPSFLFSPHTKRNPNSSGMSLSFEQENSVQNSEDFS